MKFVDGVHRLARPLAFAVTLLLAAGTQAGTIEQDLRIVENAAGDLSERATRLERRIAPGTGLIARDDGLVRFQEHVYQFLIGDFASATEGFFVLVTTGVLEGTDYHRDCEWYLADGLFRLGNTLNAEASFKLIASDQNHPFRDDAVRRLLELYAVTGQATSFYALYDREIVPGRVRPTDLITYSVGKSFYAQGDLIKAKSYLSELSEESDYYARARYYLGAILVLDPTPDNLRAAAEFFQEALSDDSTGNIARQVRDLSWLGVARIHYELAEYERATEAYNKIDGESVYFADALHEVVWTFIKQEDYRSALEAVDIFLIAFPEHHYAAQLELLQGRLHYREAQYDSALTSFEEVIADYRPVLERFGELARSNQEPREYFRQVLRLEQDLGGAIGGSVQGLPPYAVALMMQDVELANAIELHRELVSQERTITTSELLIAELLPIIEAGAGVGAMQRIRHDGLVALSEGLAQLISALAVEHRWLDKVGVPSGELAALVARRKAIEDEIESLGRRIDRAKSELDVWNRDAQEIQAELRQLALDREMAEHELTNTEGAGGDGTSLRVRIADIGRDELQLQDKLRKLDGGTALVEIIGEMAEIETSFGGASQTETLDLQLATVALRGNSLPEGTMSTALRFDLVYRILTDVVERLGSVRSRIEATEATEVERIRQRFDYEVAEVESQRAELEATVGEADQASVQVTRAGFGRLEGFFEDALLSADMGIVDVHWAKKVELVSRKKEVTNERNDLLGDLNHRFTILRQKLEQ
jgi:tetratricopeptide (TPR) repeat protein